MGLLQGKLAVVTGAGRGLGAEISKALATAGATVIAADINGENAAATAAAIGAAGGRASGATLDICDRAAVAQFADRLAQEHGVLHILVNNAGIGPISSLSDPDVLEVWDRVIATNLDGGFAMTRAFLPLLKHEGGSIIFTASISAFSAPRTSAAYGAAKAGVVSLTKYLARDLAPFKIRVNAIAPGVMETDLTADGRIGQAASKRLDRIPMGRFGAAHEVGGPVVFLASDMASYVTGATLPVDGGWMAM